MRFHRGIHPVLYRLAHEGREIGALTRADDGEIMFSLHGFHTRGAAASAARLAHSARLAFDAQRPGGPAAGKVDRALSFLAGKLNRRPGATRLRELVAREDGGEVRLYLAEEVGHLTKSARAEDGAAPLWSVSLPLGPDTPSLFAMAAARRMWGAVRSSGLWRQMSQWHPAHAPSPVA